MELTEISDEYRMRKALSNQERSKRSNSTGAQPNELPRSFSAKLPSAGAQFPEDMPRRCSSAKLADIHRRCSHVSHALTTGSSRSGGASEPVGRARTLLSEPMAKTKSMLQSLGDTLFPVVKKVKFSNNAINDATVEILSFVATDISSGGDEDEYQQAISVKLNMASDQPKSCICTRCCESFRKPPVDHSLIESEFFGMDINVNAEHLANTWMEKFLWKLNSSTNVELGADITNWRHRLFLLQECNSQLALMYTSEKDNGSLHLGCIVYKGATQETATTRVLPMITLQEMDDETKEQVATNMQDYDIAFASRHDQDYYIQRLPVVLYPVEVTWTQGAEKKRLVLASATSDGPQKLIKDFNTITQMLKWKTPTSYSTEYSNSRSGRW